MMTPRLERLKQGIRAGAHARHRQEFAPDVLSECTRDRLSWLERVTRLFVRQCEAEKPVILDGERIAFTRTVPAVPPIYTREDWARRFQGRRAHELGPISNVCADWEHVLAEGLLARRQRALAIRERRAGDDRACAFLDAAVSCIDAALHLAGRYAEEAGRVGRDDVRECFLRVPAYRPRTFREALQALRFLHATVWFCGHYHVGLGRFDQYMAPYLGADLEAGRLSRAEAEELLAEFFISLNKDTDLYPGIQQGDNGQSLMLGGMTAQGECAVNELTRMVLRVAREVSMIDPKINLRVHSRTDLTLLELAAELTREGLGFPQYSNDDVVIPGLVAHGYELTDARNYIVAACWEYIIPGKGMDVVNIGAVSLPAAVQKGLAAVLPAEGDFGDVLRAVAADIRAQVHARVEDYRGLLLPPAPWYSVLMADCLERAQDLSEGARYHNVGVHGACSSNAADALAAVNRLVYAENRVSGPLLAAALEHDWSGFEDVREIMAQGPKVGNNDDTADDLLRWLFDTFAAACEQVEDNGRGGIVRPGTGSAMYYVWLARGHEDMKEPLVGATADGRCAGDFFSSSLAPSPGAEIRGPVSVLQSFSKLDYRRLCNGGPITLELSDSVFKDPESIHKVALFVRSFAKLGCQQLQLNTLNLETLEDAKAHPGRHRNLIVRVWGWSGYFCELAPEYQDHVIARHLHAW